MIGNLVEDGVVSSLDRINFILHQQGKYMTKIMQSQEIRRQAVEFEKQNKSEEKFRKIPAKNELIIPRNYRIRNGRMDLLQPLHQVEDHDHFLFSYFFSKGKSETNSRSSKMVEKKLENWKKYLKGKGCFFYNYKDIKEKNEWLEERLKNFQTFTRPSSKFHGTHSNSSNILEQEGFSEKLSSIHDPNSQDNTQTHKEQTEQDTARVKVINPNMLLNIVEEEF